MRFSFPVHIDDEDGPAAQLVLDSSHETAQWAIAIGGSELPATTSVFRRLHISRDVREELEQVPERLLKAMAWEAYRPPIDTGERVELTSPLPRRATGGLAAEIARLVNMMTTVEGDA